MMDLSKFGTTFVQERRGIAAVQSYAAAKGLIWRETSRGDVGIDGQLEFVNLKGFATSRIIAMQVKAGPSFFQHPSDDGWKFYPEKKHRNYWEQFPLPVLLVLHNPDTGETYWVDVRQALRVPAREGQAYVNVPNANVLALLSWFQFLRACNPGMMALTQL
jgi:hypothetical protein